MNTDWHSIPLGRLLKRVERYEPRDDLQEYTFAGTYSFARGIFVSERKLGAAFKLPKIQRIKKGDFVYCKIMAWEGAFGTVPPEANLCVMSGAFVAYEHDESAVDSRFLDWYFRARSNWQRIGRQSTGTNVRRQSLHPDQFEASAICLPPLCEQRRIVARIEELTAKVEEAVELKSQIKLETEKLLASYEMAIWPDEMLRDAPSLQQVTAYLSRGRQSEQGTSEHYLVKTQHVQMGRYIPTTLRLAEHVAKKVQPDGMLSQGDILIACSAAGCLGRVARYADVGKVASSDTHVAIARANPDVIEPDYLYAYLRGAQGQYQLRSRERGDWQREKISFRLTELNLADLGNVPVPTPSRLEQHHIIKLLNNMYAKFADVVALQTETVAELDAILPAILDKAFKGEL